MGQTHGTVKLISNGKQIKKKLLVDTGSAYTWIQAQALKRLGVKVVGEEEFETIEGNIIRKKIARSK